VAPREELAAPYPEQRGLAALPEELVAPYPEQRGLAALPEELVAPYPEQRGLEQGAPRAHLTLPVLEQTSRDPELPEQEPDSREWNPIQPIPPDRGQEERSPTCPPPPEQEPDPPDRAPEPAERYPAHSTPPDQDLEPGEEPASHPKASDLVVGRPDRARTRHGSPAESGPRCPLRRTKVEVGS
jgi:hypothetical protein